MSENKKISQVLYGSIVRVDLDGKFLVGINYQDFKSWDDVQDKIYVLDSGEVIELPPDKKVEILCRGGFQLEITAVNCH